MSGDFTRYFPHLLSEWGYAAIFAAVLADSFGLPIPGEIMLLLAAVYAGATHHFVLMGVIGAAVAGAVIGDNTTYLLGRRGGYPLLKRHGHLLHLSGRRLRVGEYLFQRYGGSVVWTGRLVPVLHIWTAVLAGVNRMPWARFALANFFGAVVWATSLSLVGYALGKTALRLGGVVAGFALPVALAIGVGVVLLLRLSERRLYREAVEADRQNVA